VIFKIRRTTPFSKLMKAYCTRAGLSNDTVQFVYDGVRLQGDATPEAHDMEEEDVIDVVQKMVGGRARA
jgi:hypothetical protein